MYKKSFIKAFAFTELAAVFSLFIGHNFSTANFTKVTLFSLFLSLVYDLIIFNEK